jgi:allantoicase
VARLRVHGEVVPAAASTSSEKKEIDLAAIENGGLVLAASDEFFSEPLHLLMPGRAKNMSDGWETRRRRGEGHDWVVVKLGTIGEIRRVEVDTSHFKGNFPESCAIETIMSPEGKNPASDASVGNSPAAHEAPRKRQASLSQRASSCRHARYRIFA